MKEQKRFTLIDLSIVTAIVAILALILLPLFSQVRETQANTCQANMSRIGKAIVIYSGDYDGKYPLNPAQTIPLSDPTKIDPITGQPVVFQYGINWVEALYPYVGERAPAVGAPGVWKCPAAKELRYGGSTAAVSYSFNANFVGKSVGTVKSPKVTMMCRELDRLYGAVLRPTMATPNSSPGPPSPFLNTSDRVPTPKYRLHEEGSHILFADGHVKYFPMAYFPAIPQWNAATKQWFNYVDSVPTGDPRRLSIAITP